MPKDMRFGQNRYAWNDRCGRLLDMSKMRRDSASLGFKKYTKSLVVLYLYTLLERCQLFK